MKDYLCCNEISWLSLGDSHFLQWVWYSWKKTSLCVFLKKTYWFYDTGCSKPVIWCPTPKSFVTCFDWKCGLHFSIRCYNGGPLEIDHSTNLHLFYSAQQNVLQIGSSQVPRGLRFILSSFIHSCICVFLCLWLRVRFKGDNRGGWIWSNYIIEIS
jgi:hypothetical protein